MLSAFVFGLVASSALVIGAVAGAHWTPPRPLLASALAFASGALITALAFDLFQESFNRGGAWLSSIGLLLGAAAFVVADEALDRYIEAAGGVSAFALLAAVTLDGIPENIALGVSWLEMSGGGTLTLLVAIFLSNLPESLGGAVGMRQQGRSRRFAIGVWSVTAILLAVAVVLGNVALSSAGEGTLALLLSFAGGAVLASLADTLMPDKAVSGSPSPQPPASCSRTSSRKCESGFGRETFQNRAGQPAPASPPLVSTPPRFARRLVSISASRPVTSL